MITRRALLASLPLAAVQHAADNPVTQALQAIEKNAGGRLGAAFLDTANGKVTGYRLDDRFAMCSTFKLPLAALVLRGIDKGWLKEDEVIPFSQKDLLAHSPVTSQHTATGWMTIPALAEAAQTTSDNLAANLLLAKLGGPASFTRQLRELGADKTRLDHYEPRMNLVHPGEVNDTTTPRDMARVIARLVLRELKPATRDRLIAWMIATQTGAKRLRAGLPATWRAGDKTGSNWGDEVNAQINDIAIAWPPGGAPILVTAYYDAGQKLKEIRDQDQAVLAAVARLAPTSLAP